MVMEPCRKSQDCHCYQPTKARCSLLCGASRPKTAQLVTNTWRTSCPTACNFPILCVQVHVLHQMFPDNSSPVEATYAWTDALRWLQQIAVALKYLHGLRPMVVHRDLKLENMLLTGLDPATADAKLADFGLCKLVKVGQGGVGSRWGGVGSRWGVLLTCHAEQPMCFRLELSCSWLGLSGGLSHGWRGL